MTTPGSPRSGHGGRGILSTVMGRRPLRFSFEVEHAVGDEWQLSRITIELQRPVPVAIPSPS